MTRRVVVGFDGSPAAAVALVWATREATLRAAELVVITVLERRDPHHDVDPAKTLAAQLLKESLTGGYPVSVREFRGDAATELVGACTDTDLLVVGSRGRGPLAGLMPGSVSRACLSHAPCPVVVVPARPTRAAPRHRVMVGVDGSGHSRAALSAAAEEARLRGASLDIVHVVHWDNIGTELLTPEVDQLVEWGVKLVDDEVAATGVAGRHLIVHDNPSDVLVRDSADADLLVLGAHEHHGVEGLLLGSTSEHCVRHAHCPVMVTRVADDRQPGRQAPPAAQSRAM